MDGDITGTCFTLGQPPEPEAVNDRYNTGTAGTSCMYSGSAFRCCCLVVAALGVDTCTGSRNCNCLWHSDTQRAEPGAAPLSRTGRGCRSIVRLELLPVAGNDAGARRHGAATGTGSDNLCGYGSVVQCFTWVNRQAEAPVMRSPGVVDVFSETRRQVLSTGNGNQWCKMLLTGSLYGTGFIITSSSFHYEIIQHLCVVFPKRNAFMYSENKRIIITGGPGSGKSTLLDALHAKGFPTVTEAGRAIIKDQVAIGGNALPWKDRESFAELMLNWELRSWHESAQSKTPFFFDRGCRMLLVIWRYVICLCRRTLKGRLNYSGIHKPCSCAAMGRYLCAGYGA